ncbi:pyrroline-5-carboxylate reductase 1, mitochondrial [Planococcus citri]|uniref:pyrroline-5-carboxylate reductase 1, mitochondrial n=1 Tax=Planococcus citri TaxID=170843 RepID=UPI0031F745DB
MFVFFKCRYNIHFRMIRVGFLGAGKMAQALAKGFLKSGLVKSNGIIASCAPNDLASAQAFESLGSKVTFDNREVAQNSDVMIVAVKPSIVPIVLSDIKDHVTDKSLLLSIAMGVTLDTLQKSLPEKSKVVRVMPNTPALVQQAVSVFVPGKNVTNSDIELTKNLLLSVGICDQVPEYLLDVVTALSGSGPAYIFLIIEAMADGAVRMGMPRDMALKLSAKTVLGAADMLLNIQEHPGKLRDDVTSPAGTTSEGLHVLESHGVRSAIVKALEAATNKSKEISQLK